MRKVFCVGHDGRYSNWMQAMPESDMAKADFVLFTGGEDVSSELYGKKKHPTAYSNMDRDIYEMAAFRKARALGKPLVGICRGSQFLCVMAGGILVQHQSHPSSHEIFVLGEPGRITVTSSHHQRQHPWGRNINFRLVGWCNLSPFNWGEDKEDIGRIDPEVEIAVYPDIKALAIQSHPEYVYPCRTKEHEVYISYCRKLLDQHLESK